MTPYIKQIKLTYESAAMRKSSLERQIKKCDELEQKILHFIEFPKYDAVTGSKVLKKLSNTRIVRREAKEEIRRLQSFMTRLNNSGVFKDKVFKTISYMGDINDILNTDITSN